MIETEVQDYIKKVAHVTNLQTKAELLLRGLIQFFPFRRAALFTYSPLSYTGEGIFLIENEQVLPINDIQEDVRTILSIFQTLQRNQAEFITREEILETFPKKYVHTYQIEYAVVIIPISLVNIVIGFVIIDQYHGETPLNDSYLPLLSHYFTTPFLPAQEKNELSRRETEVLQHLSDGYSIKEMASLMSISQFTVRDYISSSIRKLGVKHRAEAVAIGIRRGIIF